MMIRLKNWPEHDNCSQGDLPDLASEVSQPDFGAQANERARQELQKKVQVHKYAL
jgi:hypothetical protein